MLHRSDFRGSWEYMAKQVMMDLTAADSIIVLAVYYMNGAEWKVRIKS